MKPTRTIPKFSVGQTVIYINSYGINWGEKTITEYEWDEVRGNVYRFEKTDAPWFMESERNFFNTTDTEAIADAMKSRRINRPGNYR